MFSGCMAWRQEKLQGLTPQMLLGIILRILYREHREHLEHLHIFSFWHSFSISHHFAACFSHQGRLGVSDPKAGCMATRQYVYRCLSANKGFEWASGHHVQVLFSSPWQRSQTCVLAHLRLIFMTTTSLRLQQQFEETGKVQPAKGPVQSGADLPFALGTSWELSGLFLHRTAQKHLYSL